VGIVCKTLPVEHSRPSATGRRLMLKIMCGNAAQVACVIHRTGRWSLRWPANGHSETVSAFREGFDISASASILSKGFTKGWYVYGEVAFLHDRIRPHEAQEIVLSNYLPGIPHEYGQDLERFWRDFYGPGATHQQRSAQVKSKIAELKYLLTYHNLHPDSYHLTIPVRVAQSPLGSRRASE
jgi:hypothetical protein